MYPVDAIKVSHEPLCPSIWTYTDQRHLDPNADLKSYTECCLQWNHTGHISNCNWRGISKTMAWNVKRCCRSRFVCLDLRVYGTWNWERYTGPAHAVYFATYEAVKHAMGGNKAGVHHPLAAGMVTHHYIWNFCSHKTSYQWGMCDNRKWCTHESIRWYILYYNTIW